MDEEQRRAVLAWWATLETDRSTIYASSDKWRVNLGRDRVNLRKLERAHWPLG